MLSLEPLYFAGTYDDAGFYCGECANTYREQLGLEWSECGARDFTDTRESDGATVYRVQSFFTVEFDTPPACNAVKCGALLLGRLTRDGEDYTAREWNNAREYFAALGYVQDYVDAVMTRNS